MSHHLLGNHSTATTVRDSNYNLLNRSIEIEHQYGTSELLLYNNLIMEETGRCRGALAHLESVSQKLVDPKSARQPDVRLHGVKMLSLEQHIPKYIDNIARLALKRRHRHLSVIDYQNPIAFSMTGQTSN